MDRWTLLAGLGALWLAGCATVDTLYNTNGNADTSSVVDRATRHVIHTIPVGQRPSGVVIDSARTFVYVANSGSDTVSVIGTAGNTVVATIAVGKRPFGVDVNPAGTRVYVANSESNTVSIIDTATRAVSATVAVGSGPTEVLVNRAGTFAFATNQLGDAISVIDLAANSVASSTRRPTRWSPPSPWETFRTVFGRPATVPECMSPSRTGERRPRSIR